VLLTRFRRPRSRSRAPGALLLAAVLLASCGGVPTIPLHELALNQEQYAGETLRTSGVVRPFADGSETYFVLEDSAANRVELLPASSVAAYAGHTVTVVGGFEVSDTLGRVLRVRSVTPAPTIRP
jgi:hypothetical protein